MSEVKTEEKANAAEGTSLFPLPDTPLGKAAREFAQNAKNIAELKAKQDNNEEQVLAEMKKEGRETLTVTVGSDNWFFEIKHGEDSLRCVKQTRQPQPKVAEKTEE